MCGIVGIWNSQREVDEGSLAAARDTMQHRGPDDAGLLVWSECGIGLGHRRLSIIDLTSSGHQPMITSDGGIAIIFNGEIYNFLELRTELQGLGHVFKSQCDTEVILLGYRQWGDDVVRRLNGMFALAIAEKATGRILLARDRAGEKPLFYYRDSQNFIFASELKAVLAFDQVDRRIDIEAFNSYLAYGYVPGGECIVQNVRKLPAGHLLVFSNNSITERAYWSVIDFSRRAGPVPSEGELIEEFEHLLMDSVRRQMIADVPTGILLSGGIDSSLVTAAAANIGVKRLRTFTTVFPGYGRMDETEHARLIAKAFNTEHHELEGSMINLDVIQELSVQYDEPMADSSMIPTFLVSKLVRTQCKVALGGDGGDELFGGYPHYARILAICAGGRRVPAAIRTWLAITAAHHLPIGLRGRTYLMGLAALNDGQIPFPATRFDAAARRQILTEVAWGKIRCHGGPEEKREATAQRFSTLLTKLTGADFLTYLIDDIMVKVDRASMLASLELRSPFLDYRIIEFAYSRVPDQLKVSSAGNKVLSKLLGRKLLPAGFAFERKQGFSIPLTKWLRNRWAAEFRSYLSELPQGVFNQSQIDRLWIGNGYWRNNSERIFALALFSLWARAYRMRF